MDESNCEMVNMITQQISIVFNPLIQNTNQNYQLLANQMGQIAEFFSAPQAQSQPIPQIVQAISIRHLTMELPLLTKGNNNKRVFDMLDLLCVGEKKSI